MPANPTPKKHAASTRFRCTTDDEKRNNAAATKAGKALTKWMRDTMNAAS
jgi:hypothetical protein